jgi:hypothetical protein
MADQYIVYAFGAGIWGVEDTAAAVVNDDNTTTHKVAAFDGPRASVQVAALLNAGALPGAALVWDDATLPTDAPPVDPPSQSDLKGTIS